MRKWLVWLVVPALLAGACSKDGGTTSDEDAAEVLASAFQETGNQQATTVTLSLASNPESLTAEGDITEDQAELILGSQLVIAGNTEDQSVRIAAEIPNTDGVEMLVIGSDLYLRADVQGLADLVGFDTSQIDTFVQQSGADFLQAAVDGQFLKFEGTEQLAGQFGANPGELTEQQQKAFEEFASALRQDAEVTSEGEDDVGEHFTFSVPLRDLYQRFLEFAQASGGGLPPGMMPPESEIPEGDFTADVWVADGKVVQLEIDFLQLAEAADEEVPEGVDELGLRLALSYDTPEIAAPSDAVTVTQEDLAGLMGGFLGGGLPGGGGVTGGGGASAPPGGEIDCSIYEGLPPETFQGLPQETLDQIEQLCPGIVPE